MKNNQLEKLSDYADYSKAKISIAEIDTKCYFSTENMLPNKGGVTEAAGLPTQDNVTKVLPENVLVSNIRPYFKKIYFANALAGASNDVLCFVAKNGCLPRYLYYLLSSDSFFDYMMAGAKGTKMPRGDKGQIMNFPVWVPEQKEQSRIVSVLSALDEKIENISKINHNLEEQAKAIFQSWFVDFEPFQDGTFVDSELGQIPAGWQVADVYSIASVIYGAPFASKRFSAEKIGRPIVRIRDLATEAPQVYTDEIHPKGYIIKPGDIVVGMDGEFRAYLWGGEEAWLNQRVCVFQPKDNFSSAFVRLSIMPLLAAVEASEVATTVIHLGKNDIDKFKIILPDAETLRKYNAVTVPIYKQIVENKLESRRLAQLRDALLPQLMSGEIDVSEVEV